MTVCEERVIIYCFYDKYMSQKLLNNSKDLQLFVQEDLEIIVSITVAKQRI